MSSGLSFASTNVWPVIMFLAVIMGGLLVGNTLKRYIPFLRKSLIPVSVLGGIFLLVISTVAKFTTGEYLFNYAIFSEGSSINGIEMLEILTYHCLAIGFIAMTLRKSDSKGMLKGRVNEVVNTGITTVSTYLLQGLLGLAITVGASFFIPKLIKASGIILCFGFGQGTGQALNYGSIYENDYGFVGGKSFGLTIAALGFLAASIGGVIYLNYHKKKGDIVIRENVSELNTELVEEEGEVPMVDSIDKLTLQISLVLVCYAITYLIMYILGNLVGEGLTTTIYGFNFLLGTLSAVIVKEILKILRKTNLMHRDYVNNFLLNRIAGFAFDVMIVAGIGAIRVDLIRDYWGVLLILAVVGVLVTFIYIKFVSFKLFKDYRHEQFMVMYGMLTGTASTGVILLREIDPSFETPASENIVYQNFPAILLGFPMMLVAAFCPRSDISTYITMGVIALYFIVLNIILFRSVIFKRKVKKENRNV
ncbi:MAG: hypothetical protein J5856_07715 [Lachnospiraceae bacterium]|nr:hypothetical protein [Lachnospiraceae bacterium]